MPIPKNTTNPVRKSAKEIAYDQILQWIIDGTLLPGEKLNDKELAEALGVSRTPIRESLQLLEDQGFVKMYPGKATQVTEIEPGLVNELIPPLAALQALATELAIPNIDSERIVELESKNERMLKAVQVNNTYSALKIDEEFHQIIVDAANNSYLSKMITSLQNHVRRLFFYNSIFISEKSFEEHTLIIKYMKEQDKQKAAEIMKNNWLRAIEEIEESNVSP